MQATTIGFIGFGLIGGSLARALRKVHPDYHMIAYSRTRSSLEQAVEDGVLDAVIDEIGPDFLPCDIIFLCTPVACNRDYLLKIKPFLKPDGIISDVGSTKNDIHRVVKELELDHCFIGTHPMAGSEKTGYANSSDHLMENAYFVITPSEQVSQEKVDRMLQVASDIKAIPLILKPDQHDFIVAGISHLPHVIAASLVNLVKAQDSEDQLMKMVAAGGFKDITRIASSSPVMWQQICTTNTENITALLRAYIDSLQEALSMLEGKRTEDIYRFFDSAREYRNTFATHSSGPIKKEFSIYCDIVDRAGAIAMISTVLAIHQINIKNIGILHNREFEEGVLKIEFYYEASLDEAVQVLAAQNFVIRKRTC